MGKDASGTTINTSAYVGRLLESIPASYTVFKIGSTYYAECNGASGTDYSDSSFSTLLNTVIDTLTTNGGKIYLKKGTYGMGGQILFKSNILLEGEGWGTILRQNDNAQINQILRGDDIDWFTMRNLQVNYNHTNNNLVAEGMKIDGESTYCTLDHCLFKDARGFAISFAGLPAARNNRITVKNCWITDPISYANDMFLVVSDYALVDGNRMVETDANGGLVIFESAHPIIVNNEVEILTGTAYGISLMSCTYGILANNKVKGPSASNGTAFQVITEHDNASPVASERNLIRGNRAYYVGTGFQFVETNYDTIMENWVDNVTTGFDFPDAGYAAPVSEYIRDNRLLNATYPIANAVGATLYLGDNIGYGAIQFIEHHTAADTLTIAESGSIHTNLGAGGSIKLTLPQDAVAGHNFEFVVMAVQQLQVDPGAAGAIYINGAKQADDAYIWADDEAESVKLVADGNGDWIAISPVGTWTVV